MYRAPVGSSAPYGRQKHCAAVSWTETARKTGLHVIAQVRATTTLQGAHRQAKRVEESRAFVLVEAPHGRAGIDARAKEHLVAEEIAHARHLRLVE